MCYCCFVSDFSANAWIFNYIFLLQSAFECKGAYYKVLGYKESDGKLESTKDYLRRLESYMKLYGALVQVCNYDLMLLTFEVLKCFIYSNRQFTKPQLSWHGAIVTPFLYPLLPSSLKAKEAYQDWFFLADRSTGFPEHTWPERRLGMDCKVLKYSACQ